MKISKKDYCYIMECHDNTFDTERHKVVYQCISPYKAAEIEKQFNENPPDNNTFYYSVYGKELFFRR